jgi:glycosyltransferase involved in cell wall biosynthesis
VGEPLVTIVTPSFNQGRFIEHTLLSIKDQDYPHIEHIIVDGGSTDHTLEVVRKAAEMYPVTWISEKDRGPADALKKGFARAHGSILGWLNSDDFYLTDNVIGTVVDHFNRNPDVQVVSGNGCYVDENNTVTGQICVDKDLITLKFMRVADFILQPSTFFRCECMNLATFKESCDYVFDWLFFLELMENDCNFLKVNDFYSAYRIHEAHRTGSNTAKRKREVARVAKRNFGFFHPQTLFCYGIFSLYAIADQAPGSGGTVLKKYTDMVNYYVSHTSHNLLYSC